MNPARHARAKEIFLAACSLAEAERARYLEESCGSDAELRATVSELLASDSSPPGWLVAVDEGGAARWLAGRLAAEERDAELDPAELPASIGAYRIVRLLGRGGMGVVYEAEQDSPRRRVALKVLSVGPYTSAHAQRLRLEAELLGRLHHPGIAHVYEAGTAEVNGVLQPYYAMELVDGSTLLEHARQHGSGLAVRLELLVQVCAAVQHAHEKGILHRDLKSSNILVDAAGRPKVLDFGVARLLVGAEDAGRSPTASGIVVGTLATMSPEQVSLSSDRLDERSDVYSLGVIAYELLTGRLPLELSHISLPNAARVLCEENPPLAGLFDRRLRGDLETILAKALAKDRAQRYGSARELADEIGRFLRREPIVARPASTFYHLRLFARRNRALVAGVLVAACALVIGSAVTGWFAWRESGLRVLAERNRVRAEREAYRGNVVAAGLALEQGNALHARSLLAEVERLERGWEWHRLRRGTEPWIAAFEINVGRIWQAGFLGRGSKAVAIGNLGAVVVWDTETGAREVELAADPARANPVALTPDGRTVLSVHEGGLRLWDSRTGEERGRVSTSARPLSDPRNTAALAPDARYFVASVRECGLMLFDAAGGGAEPRVVGRGFSAFGAGGRVLATASKAGTALWSLEDGTQLGLLAPGVVASAIAVDPMGTRIAAVDGQRRIRVFDLESGREALLPETVADVPTSLAFSPDGLRLAAMLDDGSLWVWDVPAGRLLERFGVGRGSWKTSLAWSADGERLLTAAHTHGLVRIWSLREGRAGEALRGHTSYVYPVAYSPDGSRIVSGGWDDTLRIWNAVTGECLATLESRAGRVHAVTIAPDGQAVVAATGRGTLIAWDLRTGAELARTQGGAGQVWECCVKWSPDGESLATAFAAEPGRIRLLEPKSLETRAMLEGPATAISTLAFHPGGSLLAAGSLAGKLVLWDLAKGEIRAEIGALSAVRSVAFSPDGARLVVAGDGGALALLDVPTLGGMRNLAGHAREVFSAAFSPDGSRLFSGGRDGLLRVWEVDSGGLLGEFRGHRDYIWSVAVSPDGARVATGSGDLEVRQWESEPTAATNRRRGEAVALAARAGPLVEGLLAELGEAAAVAERLADDPTLSDGMRQAALDELLRRACAAR